MPFPASKLCYLVHLVQKSSVETPQVYPSPFAALTRGSVASTTD